MHVIATAGHVDHGKSTLIRTLTGIDPDRLAEEKARGLTIDLGFAWIDLPSGDEIGIVDVPGHERFIKNMLAGVGAVDATLFVVAANEGWKPQSQEHLDILDLLEVRTAVVAVTKADTVTPEELELVIEDVRSRISSTTLAAARILGVSAVTSAGLSELVAELDRLVVAAPPPINIHRPRLWIDRSFTIKGSGTVVTGTLLEGELTTGQEVEVLPERIKARIRSIQSHRKEVSAIQPGDRTAVNLSGTEHRDLRRGDVLTSPGTHDTTTRMLVELRLLPHIREDPPDRGAFKLYVGSLELDAEVRLFGDIDGLFVALVRTRGPAPVMFGDRVVLRESGRRQTIGGGRIIETLPAESDTGEALRAKAGARFGVHDARSYATLILKEHGHMTLSALEHRTGSAHVPGATVGKRYAFDTTYLDSIEATLVAEIARHHNEHPLEVGIASTQLRVMTGLAADAFEEATAILAGRGRLATRGAALALADFTPQIGGPQRQELLQTLERAGASVPTLQELSSSFPLALIRALVRSGDLVQISVDLFYPVEFMDELKKRLKDHVVSAGPFTVATFRDLFSTTRKYAVPLLEYLDQQGFTRRDGDVRSIG